jgi:hypothetical protein
MNFDNIVETTITVMKKKNICNIKSNRVKIFLTSFLDVYNDINNIPPVNELIVWCNRSEYKMYIIQSILILYKDKSILNEFLEQSKYILDREEYITLIYNSLGIEFQQVNTRSCLRVIYSIIKNKSITANKILTTIEQSLTLDVTLSHCFSLILFTVTDIERHNVVIEFKQLYSQKYDVDSVVKSFSTESNWNKKFIEHLTHVHTTRLSRTSSYINKTLKIQLWKDVNTLKKIDKYVCDKLYPHHPDRIKNVSGLRWFLSTSTSTIIEQTLVDIGNNLVPCNDRVRSKNSRHHAKEFTVCALSLLKKHMYPFISSPHKTSIQGIKTEHILNRIENFRGEALSERRHFYEEEIIKIFDQAHKGSCKYKYRDLLLLTILREVGLRIGAISNLKIGVLLNSHGEVKRETTVLEKGKKYRTFPVGENLKQAILDYIKYYPNVQLSNGYIFHKHNNIFQKTSTGVLRNRLKTLSEKANVYGIHIHPHAFRHTIVNNLMNEGNKLENVSRFIGHSSVSTTEQYYWTSNLSNIVPTMNIPWLQHKKIECKDIDLTVGILVGVLSVYHNILTHEQKISIKQKIPNISEILNSVNTETDTDILN